MSDGGMSTYLENLIFGWIKGVDLIAHITTQFIALSTAAAGPVLVSEVTGGNYARKSIGYNTDWGTVTAGSGNVRTLANSNILTFLTASATWGTVTSASLMDASSGGNQLFSGDMSVPQTVSNGNTFAFSPGAFILSLD